MKFSKEVEAEIIAFLSRAREHPPTIEELDLFIRNIREKSKAHPYLPKSTEELNEIIDAERKSFRQKFTEYVEEHKRWLREHDKLIKQLSQTDREVIFCILEGKTKSQIAKQIFKDPETVRSSYKKIKRVAKLSDLKEAAEKLKEFGIANEGG